MQTCPSCEFKNPYHVPQTASKVSEEKKAAVHVQDIDIASIYNSIVEQKRELARKEFVKQHRIEKEIVACKQQLWRLNVKEEVHSTIVNSAKAYLKLSLQIISGFILLGIVLFILFSVHKDITGKVQNKQSEILFEVEKCKENYALNKCDPVDRLRALEEICSSFARCMNRDPYRETMKTSQVTALIGESINKFFESMSLKSVVCLFSFLFLPLVSVWWPVKITK